MIECGNRYRHVHLIRFQLLVHRLVLIELAIILTKEGWVLNEALVYLMLQHALVVLEFESRFLHLFIILLRGAVSINTL